MNPLREAAQQALEALEDLANCGAEAWSEQRPCVQIGREAITALRAALAQKEEPVEPLTIERLRYALVMSRIIPPEAVENPDEYDDGVMLHRIEALHRRIA